jgi:hypothetical protein
MRKEPANYRTWDFVTGWLAGKEEKALRQTLPILHVLAICDLDNVVDRVHLVEAWNLWLETTVEDLWTELQKSYKSRQRLSVTENCDISTKEGMTMLHHACIHSHKETAAFFLNHCSKVDVATTTGETSLHYAWTDPEIVRLLLAAGANVNATVNTGETSLMYAIDGNREESARLLLRAGALTDAKTQSGITPLELAARRDSPGMV